MAFVDPIGEAWFLGYPWYDGGLPSLNDAANDALATAISETLAFPVRNVLRNFHE
jgi:hypothetical protein